MANLFGPPEPAREAQHGIVYRNESEFGGWPFYCGLWRTADGSLLAGFKHIPLAYSGAEALNHDHLTAGAGRLATIRSTDDGITWDVATLHDVFDLKTTASQIEAAGPADYAGEAPLDLESRDTLLMTGAVPVLFGGDSRAWLQASTDGGRSWRRPILLPLLGLPSLTGNGSAIVRSDGVSLLGLTTVSRDGSTRRPVMYGSPDRGRSWTFLSYMTPIPEDDSKFVDPDVDRRFGTHRWYHPRPLLLEDGRIVATMRCQRDPRKLFWTEMFESDDGGRSWHYLSRVNDWGAPCDVVQLPDGRIVCVYGYRLAPFGIRARVSEDGGRSWGLEIVLRDDGGSWDLGYPRALSLGDGRVLTVYYINRKDDPIQINGGIRHIAWTSFRP